MSEDGYTLRVVNRVGEERELKSGTLDLMRRRLDMNAVHTGETWLIRDSEGRIVEQRGVRIDA